MRASPHTSEYLSRVIGHIHEASTNVALWPDALRAMLRFIGNSGTHLWLMDHRTGLVGQSFHTGMPDELMQQYNGEVIKECPRYANACAHPDRTYLYDYQHIDECDIDSNEYYAWLQGKGDSIRYYLGGRIHAGGVEGFQSLAFRKSEGHAQQEHMDRFAVLLPHVQQAMRIGQQFGTAQFAADSAHAVLDRLSHGVILLDDRGKAVRLNHAAEKLLRVPSPLRLVHGELRARDEGVQRALQRLIAQCLNFRREIPAFTGGDIYMLRETGVVPIRINIFPLRLASGTLEAGRLAVAVFLHGIAPVADVEPGVLREAFKLSAAESRLAALLVAGRSLTQASQSLGISLHTVRAQLKRIFAKTDVHTQSALLKVLLPFCDPR